MAGLVFVLVACGRQEPPPDQIDPVIVDTPPVVLEAPTELTEDARFMQEQILSITAKDSLRRFAELADETPGFASNFQGLGHYEHWSLLRRIGVDPMGKIEDLFALPFGVRQVGKEYWFIWPDFAALDEAELMPQRLSFQDRSRLRALIGEDGMQSLQQGGVFPGLRTAISDKGRWVYYVNDIGQGEVSDND